MNAIAIFFLNVIQNTMGMTFGWLFRPKTKQNSYIVLSDVEKVKHLEKRRQYKGYKKQWLYYRCREEGLLETYHKLFKTEARKQDSGIKSVLGNTRANLLRIFGNLIGITSIGCPNKNGWPNIWMKAI